MAEKRMGDLERDANYRWYILILAALTNAVVAAMPVMGLSVLLPEISKDLNLSLVQAGLVWGIRSMPIIISGLVSGALGDRFGPRLVLRTSSLLMGLTLASWGLSSDFFSLAGLVLLSGFLVPLINANTQKVAGVWFTNRELGLASGIIGMGMSLGFFVGSMVSATVISPWLGGWRRVFILYGALAAAFGMLWHIVNSASGTIRTTKGERSSESTFRMISHVAKLRNLWLLAFAVMSIGGGIQSLLGYLPLYLRSIGWPEINADGALAVFHLASMILVLPIALGSDRAGSRKKVLVGLSLITTIGIGLFSIAEGKLLWTAVILSGMVRDGFMAVFMAMVIETKGVGPAYSGTAVGFALAFLGIGQLLAPPFGNYLAAFGPDRPFMLWAGLAGFGLLCILLAAEPRATIDSRRMAVTNS